ncbi:MAG: hypothetical protein JW768_06615 [Chitinispirillaceae bacterium]|nr:hypothetical protein [Chitinispirillaceae bacterium]
MSNNRVVTSIAAALVMVTAIPPATEAAAPDFAMTGFAAIDGAGGQTLHGGTTGGRGGTTVTVTTAEQLLSAIATEGPRIILVSGAITLPRGMHNVTSDKSIIGVGSSAVINGGGGFNIGLPFDDEMTEAPPNAVHNIIIRNLTMTGGSDDLINVQMFSHHVWIDHCDLSNSSDGCVDIKRGSDYCTVSWNHFHDHGKTCLVGHDDSNGSQDIGHLHITFHHNWFDGTKERHPRVRYGLVHVYNNYYSEIRDYGIGIGEGSQINSEHNYFEDFEDCSQFYGTGWLKDVGSIQVNTQTFEQDPSGVRWTPSDFYQHGVDSAARVKEIVMQYAGVGKIGSSGVRGITSYTVARTGVRDRRSVAGVWNLAGVRIATRSSLSTNPGVYIVKSAHGTWRRTTF